MRVTSLTVATLASLSGNTLAFAPNANGVSRTPLTVNMASNNQHEFSVAMGQAKNGLLSVFAASMIFLGPGAAIIEPANAAAPTAAAQVSAVTTKVAVPPATKAKEVAAPATKAKEVAKPVDPLAIEKASLKAAEEKYTATSAATSKAKKAVADANTAYTKADNASESAEKKVVSVRKSLIAANDKFADAKAKEGANGGKVSALKEVETLASKVGKYNLHISFLSVYASHTYTVDNYDIQFSNLYHFVLLYRNWKGRPQRRRSRVEDHKGYQGNCGKISCRC